MRKLDLRGLGLRTLGLLAAVAALSMGEAADAARLYRWTTEDGTVAYADDVKRIPERYRARAETVMTRGLEGYGRLTPTDARATSDYAARLTDRLEYLRGASATSAAAERVWVRDRAARASAIEGLALGGMQETVRRRRVLDADGNPVWRERRLPSQLHEPVPQVGLAIDPDSEDPVIVERVQMRDDDGFTRRGTVVRQGDRILSVVKGDSHHFSPHEFLDESDFE